MIFVLQGTKSRELACEEAARLPENVDMQNQARGIAT